MEPPLANKFQFTGGMNAARGSLRTKIHENLYINRRFLSAKCACKKDGLFQYELALDKTGSWPLEELMHGKKEMSIKAILDGLKNFWYEAPNDTCSLCSQDFDETVVVPAIEKVWNNFDGLCLDCIETTKTGDFDRDYVRHHVRMNYDKNCRISHDQPTWWFSFLSRKQHPDAHGIAREQRKKGIQAR